MSTDRSAAAKNAEPTAFRHALTACRRAAGIVASMHREACWGFEREKEQRKAQRTL